MRLTSNHLLQDTESMFTQPLEPQNKNLSEYCAEHPSELIKYYCPDHKSVHCGDCIVLSNHTCKMETLPDAARGFKNSNEYQIFKTKIEDIYKNASKFKTEMVNSAITVSKLETQSKKDLKRYEEDSIKTLKQKFKELKSGIMAKAQADQSSISVLNEKYTAAQKKALSLKGDLIQKEDNEVDLFIFTQTMRESVGLLCEELENIENDQSTVRSYKLVINSEFGTFLEKQSAIVNFVYMYTENVTENVQLLKPVYRLISKHHISEVQRIASDLLADHVRITLKESDSSLEITGTKSGTVKAKYKLKALIGKVQKQKHQFSKPGLGDFMKSQQGPEIITTVEQSTFCTISSSDDDRECEGENFTQYVEDTDLYNSGSQAEVNIRATCSGYREQRLVVACGDMSEMNVDAIVNTSDDKLSLRGDLGQCLKMKG